MKYCHSKLGVCGRHRQVTLVGANTYAHIISYLLDRAIVQHLQNPPRHGLADSATCYKVYNPPTPSDPRRGQRALVAALSELTSEAREADMQQDDAIENMDAAQGL